MSELQPILLAAIAGFVSALVFSSIPVGPVNLTILNEGARRGFKWAVLIGLGASVMEVIYCSIAFTGFSTILDNRAVKSAMEVFSFVFLLFLGGRFITARSVTVPTKLGAASQKLGARLDEKLHPRSAFATGFVRVMGNLGVLLAWIVGAAYLMSHDAYFTSRYWVADRLAAKFACVGGVLVGTNVWFLVLSYSVSRGHGKFSEQTLLRMQHLSGFCLFLAGLYGGLHVIWQLAYHRVG
jgi:threonine/homoserine/homoserine lactone efflux protein